MTQISIIFDIDDTLYDQVFPIVSACEETFGLKLEDPMRFYLTFRKRSNEWFFRAEQGEVSLGDSRINRIRQTMEDLSVSISEEQAEHFQTMYEEKTLQLHMSDRLTAFMGRCTLENVRMGILTNGPHEHQMKKYYTLGLNRWISPNMILISQSAGYAKPDVRIFRMAERKMGLIPEMTWMVGDSLSNDIAGAVKAGWHSLWLARHSAAEDRISGLTPDETAYSEEELCAILEDKIKEAKSL